jgi:hypothetical protein
MMIYLKQARLVIDLKEARLMFLHTIYGTLMNNDKEATGFELISDSLELSVGWVGLNIVV